MFDAHETNTNVTQQRHIQFKTVSVARRPAGHISSTPELDAIQPYQKATFETFINFPCHKKFLEPYGTKQEKGSLGKTK